MIVRAQQLVSKLRLYAGLTSYSRSLKCSTFLQKPEFMAQSIDKAHYFNGVNYSYWKNRMLFFIKANEYRLWDVVLDGLFVPQRSKAEWNAKYRKKMQLNDKYMHILFCALGPDGYSKTSSCSSAIEIWDKLEVTHEGTNEVKETKIGLLNLEYENFKMDPEEDIKAMFDRFSTIVNGLKGYGEVIFEDKLVRKLIYSFPNSWDSKKTTIIEVKNLKELKLDKLLGSDRCENVILFSARYTIDASIETR